MNIELMKKLCCPFDHADLMLRIVTEEGDEIKEGVLNCTVCKRYYPIIFGIPIMSPDEYREHNLELPLLERWGYDAALSSREPFTLLTDGNSID